MGHFAKVNNGKVEQVIVADQEFIDNYVDTSPGTWIQTSYNTRGGVHYGEDGQPDGGVALRFNYAGVGGNYDQTADAFYMAQPFPSWTLNRSTFLWEAPASYPADNQDYRWDEDSKNWVLRTY